MDDTTKRMSGNFDSPSARDVDMNFIGGVLRKGERVGNWEIESKIAALSGEAELYIARRGEERSVVKYYHAAISPKKDILEKLVAIRHPDIVNLLEYGTSPEGRFYEVMEYARGGGLDSRKEDGSYAYFPMPDEKVLGVVSEVVNAFKAIHELGIIVSDPSSHSAI